MQMFGAVISLIGSIFFLLGVLGILRMPDTYNRIQTGTKATSLGTILFLIGIGLCQPLWFGKIILLILFIFYTNPVSSHALARAAIKFGIPLTDKTIVNIYEEDGHTNNQKEEATC
jgi:multicomponent Na+:H+ antiporter subunit G